MGQRVKVTKLTFDFNSWLTFDMCHIPLTWYDIQGSLHSRPITDIIYQIVIISKISINSPALYEHAITIAFHFSVWWGFNDGVEWNDVILLAIYNYFNDEFIPLNYHFFVQIITENSFLFRWKKRAPRTSTRDTSDWMSEGYRIPSARSWMVSWLLGRDEWLNSIHSITTR